jgi:hypothetical protein
VAAIALAAAGMAAAVGVSGKPKTPEPQHLLMQDAGIPVSVAPVNFGGLRVELMSTQTPLASETLLAAGGSVDVGDGITFDIPGGWKILGYERGFAQVVNLSNSASFAVWTGIATPTNPSKPITAADVLAVKVKDLQNAYGSGLRIDQTSTAQQVDLKPELQVNFDQSAATTWTGTLTTQQGSNPKVGELALLFNSGTNSKLKTRPGFFAFVVTEAPDDQKYSAAAPDLTKMYAQLLGASATS